MKTTEDIYNYILKKIRDYKAKKITDHPCVNDILQYLFLELNRKEKLKLINWLKKK